MTDYDDIWEALTGSDFMGLSHWVATMSCDYREPEKPFPVTHLQEHDDDYVTTTVTPVMIKDGFIKAVEANQHHCGHYRIEDLDNQDGCFADIVMQYAIFGKLVFG